MRKHQPSVVGDFMKLILSFILILNTYASALGSPKESLASDRFNQKKQFILQILNNEDGIKLKTALKEILPSEDHSFIDTHISDQIKINYKIKNDVIIIDNKTKIVLTTDDAIILNGVRVKYDRSLSFENNIKNLSEKARQFGVINFFLPQKAHAVLPGLIAGKIAIDVLVPAIILGLTSALAVSYGSLVWKFFNYSLIDNAEIICSRNGKLYHNFIQNDFNIDLPEVTVIQKSILEYEKLLPQDYKCTNELAKDAQIKIRNIASTAAKKMKNDQLIEASKTKSLKDAPAPQRRSGSSH